MGMRYEDQRQPPPNGSSILLRELEAVLSLSTTEKIIVILILILVILSVFTLKAAKGLKGNIHWVFLGGFITALVMLLVM